jgi:ABC-type glutathione transport system ATPase component
MVIASHDMGFVQRLCPRALILHRGQVVAGAPTEELLSDGDLLARYGLA